MIYTLIKKYEIKVTGKYNKKTPIPLIDSFLVL